MAEPLWKRLAAAYLMGDQRVRAGGMSTQASATEPMAVLVAYEFGRVVYMWRREMLPMVAEGIARLVAFAVLVGITGFLWLALPTMALRRRRRARREIAARRSTPETPRDEEAT